MKTFQVVNPTDKCYTENMFLLEFSGAKLIAYANHAGDALDEVVDYCVDNLPGFICNQAAVWLYNEGIADGLSVEKSQDRVNEYYTTAGNYSDYIELGQFHLRQVTKKDLIAINKASH